MNDVATTSSITSATTSATTSPKTAPKTAPTHRKSSAELATPRLPRRNIEIPTKHQSDTTSLIYQVIMGAAACLALIGVIQQAKQADNTSIDTSTDAPPPAVFVQTD